MLAAFLHGSMKIFHKKCVSSLNERKQLTTMTQQNSKYPAYDFVGEFSEGLARVRRGNKWGYINEEGKEIIPLIYDYAHDFHNGTTSVKFGNENPRINRQNKIVFKG